ncbi:helix-turn-helix domain-containing protein [Faecalicatena orotica]|uniref:Helix-turn-helix protein n=1 Tax=Faecalicatena orotica TaxID=1544 RepID=A0A2Y9BPC1_9FIRM|nr:helix-turn-helix domain-containing protein [Faecalicatena orotica]PWJ22578.1 helix-turn-helix protein [Faecalicatena orotica]SSA58247.1 Helix-turn-helix domain-containing protein [Faecalicatena orotica]
MDENDYKLLKNILQSQGINIHVFQKPYENMDEFDNGLRKQLYMNYDYTEVERKLRSLKSSHLYLINDVFGVCYVAITGRDKEDDATYIMAGPYLKRESIPDMDNIISRNKLELYHISMLQEYYNSLPITQDIETTVYTFFEYFVKEIPLKMDYMELEFGEIYKELEIRIEDEDKLTMGLIEDRYRNEDELLEAVECGDQTKAILLMNEIGKYRIEARSRDSFREKQNMTLTLNVLFRKSVQHARVHPAHIDEVSAAFARRIDISTTESELSKLILEMIKRYCRLVQSYSLKNYSAIVAAVINYVEFNIKEPLGLGYLAEKLSVNASYLSGQFKRETGETLTNYVNKKRIQKSLFFLATTNLPIQEVAARVGIYDENYFSRIFKKFQLMTPREYRSAMYGTVEY